MSDYGQSVLDTTDTLEGTWTYDGDEYNLKVEDISGANFSRLQEYVSGMMELQALGEDASESEIERIKADMEGVEAFSWEDEDNQSDLVLTLINEKLVKPACDPEETGNAKVHALLIGMVETWQEATAVGQAKEEMPLDKGNR